MRDAVSQPSLDIEESYFSKNTLFFFKNDFSFYYLKLYTPSVPLIGGFKAFFGPPFCSLTEGKEEKDAPLLLLGTSLHLQKPSNYLCH